MREYPESRGQTYVLRVASNFTPTLTDGAVLTCAPRHCLLIRRHLRTAELAFHYCYVPAHQLLTNTRLIRAAVFAGRGSNEMLL